MSKGVRWEVFQDRTALSELPSELVCTLEHRGLVEAKTRSVQFVGCIAYKDRFAAFVPLGLAVDAFTSSPRMLDDCLCLVMDTLDEAERYRPTDLTTFNDEEDINVEIVSVARDLFLDYAEHGLHTQRDPLYERGQSGVVSWARTISRCLPLIVDGGTPVYPSTIVRRVTKSETSVLRRAQETALREIWRPLGWWLKKATGVELPEYVRVRLVDSERYELVEQLSDCRDRTYDDRGLRLIELLIRYFQAALRKEGDEQVFGSSTFEGVWETMLARVLGASKSTVLTRTPSLRYRAKPTRRPNLSTLRLVPDIIIESNDSVLLLDAKYYSAQSVASSPQLADIYKQLSYQLAVEAQLFNVGLSHRFVQNAFLFPATAEGGRWDDITFVFDDGSCPEALITCFYLDTEKVMRAFVERRIQMLSELVC